MFDLLLARNSRLLLECSKTISSQIQLLLGHNQLFDVVKKPRSTEPEQRSVQILIPQCFFDKSQPLDCVIDRSHTSSGLQPNLLSGQTMEFLNRPYHAKTNRQSGIDLKFKLLVSRFVEIPMKNLTVSFPVEVLIKSAPAIMHTIEAL